MSFVISQVNNFLTPFGGAEDIVQKTVSGLQQFGHTVQLFGTCKQPYFDAALDSQASLASYVDYDDLSGLDKLKALKRPFYNKEAENSFRHALKINKPNIVHFHNIHWHLSPSVIQPCLDSNIPTVMTIHEARNICPAGTLMRNGESYCKELLCSKQSPKNALKYRCYDGSLVKSAYVAAEFMYRQYHKLFDEIDHFIAPSKALADLIIESGMPPDKISVVPNPLGNDWLQQTSPTTTGDYFFFAGRLSAEKGVNTLLEAMAIAGKDIPLKIAGTGDQAERLKEQTRTLGLKNVDFLGFQDKDSLKSLYRNAIATVVPSEWFETFGLTVIESMSCGRPVIASNIGGPANIINSSKTGVLFEMKDVETLSTILMNWHTEPKIPLAMGDPSVRFVNEHCTLRTYTESLLDVYSTLNNPNLSI